MQSCDTLNELLYTGGITLSLSEYKRLIRKEMALDLVHAALIEAQGSYLRDDLLNSICAAVYNAKPAPDEWPDEAAGNIAAASVES